MSIKNSFKEIKEENEYQKLQTVGTEVINQPNYIEKYEQLQNSYNNEDIIGTITIPNVLNTLIVQTNDNTYYLNNSLYKKYSKLGSVFMDYRNNINSKQINIYGHNSSKYDLPFKKLLQYLNIDFINNNKIIYVETKEGVIKYRISLVKTTLSNEHMNLVYQNDNQWLNHLSIMNQDVIYKEKQLELNNSLLVLQTCILTTNKYLIIIAIKI